MFMAGFECSTHRRPDGRRLDVSAGARHDVFARQDYVACARHGLTTARDGLRWHRIETAPGAYDWSSWLPLLRASQAAGVSVIWDIWHYGTPDDIDFWSPAFVDRLVAFAREAARVFREEGDAVPMWCPLNEMSFFSFIAGDHGIWHPYGRGRGYEMKVQLARAAIAVSEALLDVDPRARFLTAEPLINIRPGSGEPHAIAEAQGAHDAQYQAFDMLCGRLEPQLGGRPELLDVVGANFYPTNQWTLHGPQTPFGHHDWRALSDMLLDLHARYDRPVIIAETGAEGSTRAPWFAYVAQEVLDARERGADVQGVCLYPVTTYPGWDNDRDCATGLLGLADDEGRRTPYPPLLAELERWREIYGARTSRSA